MNCSGCGAPLAVDALVCGFCGLHNAVDLLAIRDFKLLAERSELACPNQCGPLRLLALGAKLKVTVGHCPSCNGLHFAPGALQIALDQVAAQVREINHARLEQILAQRVKPEAVRYKPCPTCHTMMNRQAFSQYIRVIVDECKLHGVWLDSGEFTILAEWMEAGGRHHIEAEEARRIRVDQANGDVSPIRTRSDGEAGLAASTSQPANPLIAESILHQQPRAKTAAGHLPPWVVGAVLSSLLWFILGWSWPVGLLVAGTVVGWIWRDRL